MSRWLRVAENTLTQETQYIKNNESMNSPEPAIVEELTVGDKAHSEHGAIDKEVIRQKLNDDPDTHQAVAAISDYEPATRMESDLNYHTSMGIVGTNFGYSAKKK